MSAPDDGAAPRRPAIAGRPSLVVLDGFTLNPGDNPWGPLAALGDLAVHDRTPPEQVHERSREADVLLTNKTLLPASVLESLPRLRLISILATGTNVVDLEVARRLGIVVSNVPEYSTDSVAQHTWALLLELTQRTGEHAAAVRVGAWARCPDFSFWHRPPIELAERTLGVVGFGRIGRRVAAIARAFGMKVVACGRSEVAPVDLPPWVRWSDVDRVFREADVVSLHCPLTEANHHLANASRLARMKPEAFLINTARGGLIDEEALAAALSTGQLAGAALDVVSREPMPHGHPLQLAPNCLITPHLAWASRAARHRLMNETAGNVRSFLEGVPRHRVA